MPNTRRAREDNEEEEEIGVNKKRQKQREDESPNNGNSTSSSSSSNENKNENQEDEQKEDDGDLSNPNRPNEPRTPTLEEYTRHQITHYPSQPWCPICVKNAAVNNTHKKTNLTREAETFSLDYIFMSKKPEGTEILHPILVIKAKNSGGGYGLNQ